MGIRSRYRQAAIHCGLFRDTRLRHTSHRQFGTPALSLCFHISAFSFLSSLGRRGTALGRFWDGSKHAESSMIARLGTAGWLGEGGVWVCGDSSLLWWPKIFVWSADFVVLSESFRTLPNLSEPFRGINFSQQVIMMRD